MTDPMGVDKAHTSAKLASAAHLAAIITASVASLIIALALGGIDRSWLGAVATHGIPRMGVFVLYLLGAQLAVDALLAVEVVRRSAPAWARFVAAVALYFGAGVLFSMTYAAA